MAQWVEDRDVVLHYRINDAQSVLAPLRLPTATYTLKTRAAVLPMPRLQKTILSNVLVVRFPVMNHHYAVVQWKQILALSRYSSSHLARYLDSLHVEPADKSL